MLDVGWGTGELALYLASTGHQVLGAARSDDRTTYGITPDELGRFGAAGGWEVIFAEETTFERRWKANPACFVGVRRR